MTKPYFLKQYWLPILTAIIVLMAACDGGPTGKISTSPKQIKLSKYLDTLYIDSARFVKLDTGKRTVFEFKIDSLENLTMEGWTAPDSITQDFPNDTIKLLNGRPDTAQILEPTIYFGNQILHQHQIKKIKRLLASLKNAPYVLFVPYKDKGHVTYKIWIGFADPKVKDSVDFTTGPANTNEGLNPSPPKSYAK